MAPKAAQVQDEDITNTKVIVSDDTRTSVDILREVMIFHDTKAKDIIIEILAQLKVENRRGDLIAMMYKKYSETIALVVDCAAKLAPYEKPKLQSVEIKKEVEHRFVLRVPDQGTSSKDWLDQIAPQQNKEPIKLFEAIANKPDDPPQANDPPKKPTIIEQEEIDDIGELHDIEEYDPDQDYEEGNY